jgi:hypothetical protein
MARASSYLERRRRKNERNASITPGNSATARVSIGPILPSRSKANLALCPPTSPSKIVPSQKRCDIVFERRGLKGAPI